jgi:hypothetical protein
MEQPSAVPWLLFAPAEPHDETFVLGHKDFQSGRE